MANDDSDASKGRKSVVPIFNGFETSLYRRFSARLPEMLEKYPIGEYRYGVEFVDELFMEKGKLAVLTAAAAAGKLSSFPTATRMICTRKLLSKDGTVLAEATAAGQIHEHKDYEKLETASMQRLAAMLGFAGEILDADEDLDLQQQQSRTGSVPSQNSGSDPVILMPVRSERPVVAQTSTETKSVEVVADSSPQVGTPTEAGTSTGTATNTLVDGGKPRDTDLSREPPASGVPVALARQVTNQANRLGVQANAFSTEAEAYAELERLGNIQRGRRTRRTG